MLGWDFERGGGAAHWDGKSLEVEMLSLGNGVKKVANSRNGVVGALYLDPLNSMLLGKRVGELIC
jgi:hypothetical protein